MNLFATSTFLKSRMGMFFLSLSLIMYVSNAQAKKFGLDLDYCQVEQRSAAEFQIISLQQVLQENIVLSILPVEDSDSDGVLDVDDLDDDNDGILDLDEIALGPDTDGDLVDNILDTDSDNDGCGDALEGNGLILSSQLDVNLRISGGVDVNGIPLAVSGGQADVSSTDPLFIAPQCAEGEDICGPVNSLFQTIGISATSTCEVHKFNRFVQTYVKVGELVASGVTHSSASNSAYNLFTGYIYTAQGNVLRAFDPENNFAFVGEITLSSGSPAFNNTLFAQEEFVGFVLNNQVIKFDVTGILSYPSVITPTVIDLTGGTPFSTGGATPNDFSLLGDSIYGARGTTLHVVHANTGAWFSRSLNLVGGTGDGNGWGASWQDIDGSWYAFNNNSGNIYKVNEVRTALATPGTIDFELVFTSAPSGLNDGFGCERIPNLLDWDVDGVEDAVDLDDDNDGILDTDENGGLDPLADGDGDGIPALLDDDDTNGGIGNVDGMIELIFDLDGDGIPNQYDVDSDGDGCPDAQEGSGLFAQGDINTESMLLGGVDANGVPSAASGGQADVSSQNSGVTGGQCDDDGDGVINQDDTSSSDPCDPDPLAIALGDCDSDGTLNGAETDAIAAKDPVCLILRQFPRAIVTAMD